MPINTKEDPNLDIESSDDASFVPTETDADSDSEKSDAQNVDEGLLVLDAGEDTLDVSPNDGPTEPPADEKKEDETEDEETGEKPPEGETEGDEKPADDKEEKKETEAKPPAAAPGKVQKRINNITKEKFDAIRERDRLAKENADLKNKLKESSDANDITDLESKEPSAEDFETEGEYYKALSLWGGDMAVLKDSQKPVGEPAAEETKDNPVDEMMKLGEETYPDWAEIVYNPEVHINESIANAVQGSEHAVAILHHMGKNAEDTNRIATLEPLQIAREIGRIETLFEGDEVVVHDVDQDTEEPGETKPNETISKAPTPVTPDTGNSAVMRDLDNASIADYRKTRGYTREGDREGDRPKVA